MKQTDLRWEGWRGVCLVAITYVYFLIFAQFAFLKRLAEFGVAEAHLKVVMAAMAGGGILLSLVTPRTRFCPSPYVRLRAGLGACAAAAALTLHPLGLTASLCVSFLIGVGLGLLTVTLVTYLPLWIGTAQPLFKVGLGTGIGYLACNVPSLFTASARAQAATSAVLCLAGAALTFGDSPRSLYVEELYAQNVAAPPLVRDERTLSFPRALAAFTALVWLDSAAFYIIQHNVSLRSGTWQGSLHLWMIGALHLMAALLSARLLRLRGPQRVLTLAYCALACACLLLLTPGHALLASAFYPVGVSLYSVALVAYPSLLTPARTRFERGREAGSIYAVAGWTGSAMGIGMAQNLGHIPLLFLILAGVVILSPALLTIMRSRRREVVATLFVLALAALVERAAVISHSQRTYATAAERGRQVYISEGCINCHSQYVRPHTADVLMWGPAQSLEELRQERPPLIGNRRQGPDLSAVGSRRSSLWLKAHFYHPAGVSYASFMPSYAYLFRDGRGVDLIAYLETLRGENSAEHLAQERAWHLSPALPAQGSPVDGALLYQRYCATCHSGGGATRNQWKTSFRVLPTNLGKGPYLYLDVQAPIAQTTNQLAHILKFGIPGTDMAGHEYLPDAQVAALTRWLEDSVLPFFPSNSTETSKGMHP